MAKRLDVKQVVELLHTEKATVGEMAQKFGVNKATVTRALTQLKVSNPEISVLGTRQTGKRGRPQKIFGVKPAETTPVSP